MKRILIATVVALALIGGAVLGVKQYKTWRQTRLIEKAKSYLAAADYRNASLCARQAVESDPDSVEAVRVMAYLAELGRSTNALFWRRRVVQLEPHNPENQLMLARTALFFGQRSVAAQALDSSDEATLQGATYHKLQGNLSWGSGKLAEAEGHFREALRLEPTNAVSRLNLNLVRLVSTNPATSASARAELLATATNDITRREVLRQLCTDAIRRNKFNDAAHYSQELLAAGAGLPDQLRHLTLLREGKKPEFNGYFKTLQTQCQTNASEAAALARWMMAAGLSEQEVAWLKSLPDAIRDQRPVTETLADALLQRADWAALAAHLKNRAWDENEYLRQLLLARVAREEQNNSGARSHWLRAIKAASGHADRLTQLARTTESWHWREEMEDALNALVAQFPEQKWAEEYLSVSLHLSGKTLALQNLFARRMEREPTNNVAKSNFATLGLLLDPKDKRLHKLAEELYRSEPAHAFIASTYALSLHFQQRTADALEVMGKLPPERLEDPAIAVWYGLLLAETGQSQRAQKYLHLAEKAKLLPEEKRLLAQVRAKG